MVRFGNDKTTRLPLNSSKLFLIIFAIIIILFFVALSHFGTANTQKQKESLENAIDRCIVECYALEGTYPPSLEYMEEHYGLTYNDDTFFVDYQAIGGNIRPDVTIIVRNGE